MFPRKFAKPDVSSFPYLVMLKIDKHPSAVISYFKTKLAADSYSDRMNCFRGFSAKVKFNPEYKASEIKGQ